MEEKRLKLIKVLLSYVIEKNRQEKKFLNYMNDNANLYNVDISIVDDFPFYEMAKSLNIENEEKAEEIYEFLNRMDASVHDLVEEFCKKYRI